VVVGPPFDGTASFRSGSRDGPDAIRLASFNFESYDHYYDVDLAELAICDLGNMNLGADPAYAEETIKEGIALLPKAAIPIFLGRTGCRDRESPPLQRWDESCPAVISCGPTTILGNEAY